MDYAEALSGQEKKGQGSDKDEVSQFYHKSQESEGELASKTSLLRVNNDKQGRKKTMIYLLNNKKKNISRTLTVK